MISRLIDKFTDKFYDFDIQKDHDRTILTGGWLVFFACLVLLSDSGFMIPAGGLALLGAGFFFGGLYNLIKAEKRVLLNRKKGKGELA